jgi:hypothetical protein
MVAMKLSVEAHSSFSFETLLKNHYTHRELK